MLLNVRSDGHFQKYLDGSEQKLFVLMQPLLQAAIKRQAATNSVQAHDYVVARGKPILTRHYARIYGEQFNAISYQAAVKPRLTTKAAGDDAVSTFLAEQLAALERRAGQHIRTIAESLIAGVQQALMDLVAEGASNQEIARVLRRLAPDLSKRQAATIARTETHSTALDAINASIRSQGIEIQSKTWWANLDKRVRLEHEEAHEQVRNVDEPFEVGGERLNYPGDQSLGAGPGNVINCRCSVMYSSIEEAPPEVQPAQPTPAPVGPPKSPEERAWNERSFSTAPDLMRTVILKTKPLTRVELHNKNSQYSHQGVIWMESDYADKAPDGQVVWRHEYGHHFDRMRSPSPHYYWSGTLKAEAAADSKAVVAAQRTFDRTLSDKLFADAGRLYDKYTDLESAMTPDVAMRHVIHNDIFPTRPHLADAVLALHHPEPGENRGPMAMIRTALRLASGDVAGFIRNVADTSGVLQKKVDREAWRSIHMFSDYLGALTKEVVGRGHGKSYYAQRKAVLPELLNHGQGTEMMANYWALKGSSNPAVRAMTTILKELAPRTWKAFEAELERAAHE